MANKLSVKFKDKEELEAVAAIARHLKITPSHFIRAAAIQAVNSVLKQWTLNNEAKSQTNNAAGVPSENSDSNAQSESSPS